MPYYPEGKELEDACKTLRMYSVCAECSGDLEVLYDMDNHRPYVVCKENEAHEGLRKTRPDTLKQIREEFSMDSIALMKMDKPGMVARIEQAKWPAALKPEEKALVATVALSYGLDPILNELSIYQGRPYPTINAWYRKSQETGQFDGMDSRPATDVERAERNAEDGDLLYRCEVWRKGATHAFVGWGKVLAKERKGNEHLPIVKYSDRMCEKRSEMQAMRKAFSIPMPTMSFEEIPGVGKVDTRSGEIIEGEAREIEPEPEPEAAEPTPEPIAEESKSTPPLPDSAIDLDWLRESAKSIKWTEKTLTTWITAKFKVKGGILEEVVAELSPEQCKDLAQQMQERVDMK